MINLVVALVAESRPIISHFDLRPSDDSVGFRIYTDGRIRLVVTGMGRVAAAAGTAYLHGFACAAKNEAWLNVGVGGHAVLEVGSGIHALRILDGATGRSWYPPQIVALPGRGKTVSTVDEVENEYRNDTVFDMEASGYFATAIRFSVGELVQCYKVISDNRQTGTRKVSAGTVSELIASRLPALETIVQELDRVAEDLADTQPRLNDFDHFLERWHFTVSQEHELRTLLQRWAASTRGAPVWTETLNRCPSAKSVLAELRDRIDQLPV